MAMRKRSNALTSKKFGLRKKNAPLSKGTVVYYNKGREITRVEHSELIDTVSADGVVYRYDLGPGNEDIYHWVPAIAQRFEYYRVVKFEVRFRSSVGANTSGLVHRAVDYDVSDPAPSGSERMSNYSTYLSHNAWDSQVLRLDPVAMNRVPWHFCGNALLRPTMYDQKLYDFGALYVLGSNTGGAEIGELHFDYTFEFSSPQLEDSEETLVTLDVHTTGAAADQGKLMLPATLGSTIGQSILAKKGLSPVLYAITPNAWSHTLSTAVTDWQEKYGLVLKFLRDFNGSVFLQAFNHPIAAAGCTDCGHLYQPSLRKFLKEDVDAGDLTKGIDLNPPGSEEFIPEPLYSKDGTADAAPYLKRTSVIPVANFRKGDCIMPFVHYDQNPFEHVPASDWYAHHASHASLECLFKSLGGNTDWLWTVSTSDPRKRTGSLKGSLLPKNFRCLASGREAFNEPSGKPGVTAKSGPSEDDGRLVPPLAPSSGPDPLKMKSEETYDKYIMRLFRDGIIQPPAQISKCD